MCPSVRALVTEAGAVPFEAFPGLAELVQGGSWQPSAFTSLAQHCSGLQQLHISSHFDTSVPSMPLHTPAADCARAVRSLSALQQLTWLSFAPYGRPEVSLAFAAVLMCIACSTIVCRMHMPQTGVLAPGTCIHASSCFNMMVRW